MRAELLFLGSLAMTAMVVGNAFYQKEQFYPSVVHITKSNPSMMVVYFQALIVVILLGKLMKKVFFGQLRAAEVEHLIDRSWYAVTETCLAFTVFKDDFSTKFVALFTVLLFLKAFHWLLEDRVDFMERSPVITWLFHLRATSLLLLLGALDAHFISLAYHSTLAHGASVQLVFGFEYSILVTMLLAVGLKYILHAIDLASDSPWENKAVYLLYSELIVGLVKVVLYVMFLLIMIRVYTFPLFAIRPMYLAIRSFKKALLDVVQSRRAIHHMNTLYPDATSEELAAVDNVCIICREEMVAGSKKLPCNHIFHTNCLRSWFQRQQTCPTCRLDVLRPPATPTSQAQPPRSPPAQPQPVPANQVPPTPQPAQPNTPVAPGVVPPEMRAPFWPPFAQNPTGAPAAEGVNIPPFLLPPIPFMAFTVPPPMPPASFEGLTTEELQAMESNERKAVEARIQCLRNIQTLLDAAVLQMQQYTAVVSRLNVEIPVQNGSQQSNPTATNMTETVAGAEANPPSSLNDVQNTVEEKNVVEDVTSPRGDQSVEESEENLSEQERLRRRRLQRFNVEN
nr:EOG090X03TK [Triops cancriformis]